MNARGILFVIAFLAFSTGCTSRPTVLPSSSFSAIAAAKVSKHTYLWVEGAVAYSSKRSIFEYPLDGGTSPHPTIWSKASLWPALPRPAFDPANDVLWPVEGGQPPFDLGVVDVYGPSSTTKPSKNFQQGLAVGRPYDAICDAAGNLYIANLEPTRGKHLQWTGEVAVYPPGKTVASYAITHGADWPESLAFDSAGNLYVSNLGTKAVTVFKPGGMKPIRAIQFQRNQIPHNVAFDRNDNVYVGTRPEQNYLDGKVFVYAANSTTRLRTLTDSIVVPLSIAVDSAGYVFVANAQNVNSPGTWVSVFAPGSTVARKMKYAKNPYAGAWSVLVDANGNLYVAWAGATTISVYGSHGTKFLRTIQTPSYPFAMGFITR